MWKSNFRLFVQFQGQPSPLIFPVKTEGLASGLARPAVEAGAHEPVLSA
jgi:hypothetical protein